MKEDGASGSYFGILKSSILVGGSAGCGIIIGFIRTKIYAVALGPQGMAIAGLFASIADIGHCVSGLGLNCSGVRKVAESSATGDDRQIALTAAVLKKTACVMALIGALVIIIGSGPIARLTFGSDAHQAAVACISIAVFLRVIASSRDALIIGMRRIGSLAKMSMSGSFFGTLFSLPFVIWLGYQGIVPALIAGTVASYGVSWWFSRKIRLPRVSLTCVEIRSEVPDLIRLGVVLMGSGLLSLATVYVLRILIIKQSGLEAGGLYQAAVTLGSLYVGLILNSMSADFLPRMMLAGKSMMETNRLVNEQLEIAMLLGAPGIIATITFHPIVITAFYSESFIGAGDMLTLIALGMIPRITAWTLDHVVLSQGRKCILLFRESAFALLQIMLAWAGLRVFGIYGAGIALACCHCIQAAVAIILARRISGFAFSKRCRLIIAVMVSFVVTVFIMRLMANEYITYVFGMMATLFTAAFAARQVLRDLPVQYAQYGRLSWLRSRFCRDKA